MKFTQFILSLFLVLALSACKTVKTPEGKVPAEYLDAAKTLAGTYQGDFNGVPSEILLQFDGATPVLTYTNVAGHDLLGVGCGSEIGKLAGVTLDPLAYVTDAYFELSPGNCPVEGQIVTLEFQQKGDELTVSVVKGHRIVHIPAQESCHSDAWGSYTCDEILESDETVYDVLQGTFKKLK
ncbi:MAG: hypothetical protein ACJ763_01870 [Bdellovibrionia bacterium]